MFFPIFNFNKKCNYLSLTQSAGRDLFRVELKSTYADFVRARVEVLDFNDGIYLVRYRLVDSYSDLIISLTNRLGQHVANSPYHLEGKTTNYIVPSHSLLTHLTRSFLF